MLYLILAVLVVVAVLVALPLLRRNTRLDEVDRFHVARSLTTTWAADPPAKAPVLDSGEEG